MILTVEETKVHLRVEHDEEDAYIAGLIAQAQAIAEDYTRVSYDDEEPPPEPVRLACLLMVSYLYENRDVPDNASYNAMRRAFNNLLYPHRSPELMF